MNELQSWLDNDPERRRCSITSHGPGDWRVSVWDIGRCTPGDASGHSVTFATVAAILDWSAKNKSD